MNNTKLGNLLSNLLPTVTSYAAGHWSGLLSGGFRFYCLTDERADRMRFIVPVMRVSPSDSCLVYRCLEANFSTALDAKYAVHDGVLWSTFVHPLSMLTEALAIDAFRQVVVLAGSTGSTFSSGSLVFVGNVSASLPQDGDQTRKRLPPQLVRGKAKETIPDSEPPPPDAFVCPITLDLMQEPVTTPSGHSFERLAIETHIRCYRNDPFTGRPLQPGELRPNRALKEAIEEWRLGQREKEQNKTEARGRTEKSGT